METNTLTDSQCYHCGTARTKTVYEFDEKPFCCVGRRSVYQVLTSNNLCSYYVYNASSGQSQTNGLQHYEYLNEPGIVSKLVDYIDKK